MRLKRPTQIQRGLRYRISIWSCSRWGLPCRNRCRCRGALLPHHFTLTGMIVTPKRFSTGGIFSAALSVDSRRPGVTWHRAPGARTFLLDGIPDDCPTNSILLGKFYRNTFLLVCNSSEIWWAQLSSPKFPYSSQSWLLIAVGGCTCKVHCD